MKVPDNFLADNKRSFKKIAPDKGR